LYINDNNISCMPEVYTIADFHWANTNIHCFPNYGNIGSASPSVANVPLCQPSDTCPGLWNITGKVFFDKDSDCVQDITDTSLRYIPVSLYSGSTLLQ